MCTSEGADMESGEAQGIPAVQRPLGNLNGGVSAKWRIGLGSGVLLLSHSGVVLKERCCTDSQDRVLPGVTV